MNQIANLVKIAQELSELGFQDDANAILDEVSNLDVDIDPNNANQTLINLIGGVFYGMAIHEGSLNFTDGKLDEKSMNILRNSVSELLKNPDLT